MVRILSRKILVLLLAGVALYGAWAGAGVPLPSLPGALLRANLPALHGDGLPLRLAMVLREVPALYYAAPQEQDESAVPGAPQIISPPTAVVSEEKTPLTYPENGVPSQTVQVLNPKGFTPYGEVYIKNSSGKTLSAEMLESAAFVPLAEGAPQVLILHTHGSESYTPSDDRWTVNEEYRTSDTRYNVVRVGDEVAAALSAQGLSVVHDRILYDDPLYDGAYGRSAEAIEAYLQKYPSITYVLDIHRDAVEDSAGNQYKLITAEDETLAQVSFIMGSSHDGWEENLKLAVSVADAMVQNHPTIMRPVTLRSSNYNQHLSPGAMLVEIGTAGNSLEEALHAARCFGEAFARTVQG